MSSVHTLGAKDRDMLPPPSRSGNVARRGGHSSNGRGGASAARRSTLGPDVAPTPSPSTVRWPEGMPQFGSAANTGRPDQGQQQRTKQQQAKQKQVQQPQVQQQPPPAANMITASQEQKGISHGRLESQTDSDRTLSGQLVASDIQEAAPAGPSSRRADLAIATEHARSQTPTEVREYYKAQAERAERRRDREDPDFVLASQETRDVPFNEVIESQELEFVRQTSASLVDRTRRASRAQPTSRPNPQQPNTPHSARRASGNAHQGPDEHVDDNSMDGLLRANPSATVTPVSHRTQRESAPGAAQISPATLDENAKGQVQRNKGKRTRNQSWEKCGPENRRERYEHIEAIKANWNSPALFWPDELRPMGEKQVPNGRGGMTTVKEALEPRDVSTLLLKAMRRFSEVTKDDYWAAMKLIKKAVERRIQRPDEHNILLPDDVEQATKSALSKAKAPVQGAGAGSSAKKRRAQQAVEDEPDSRRVRTPDREDGVFCTPSTPETPTRQLEDQLMTNADTDGNDSDQEMGQRTQESLFGPEPMVEDAAAPEQSELNATGSGGLDSAPAASLPSPDSDSAPEPQHQEKEEDISIIEVKQKARANAFAARTVSLTVGPDEDWEEIAAEAQQLFYLKAKAAKAQGKQLVMSFGLSQ